MGLNDFVQFCINTGIMPIIVRNIDSGLFNVVVEVRGNRFYMLKRDSSYAEFDRWQSIANQMLKRGITGFVFEDSPQYLARLSEEKALQSQKPMEV